MKPMSVNLMKKPGLLLLTIYLAGVQSSVKAQINAYAKVTNVTTNTLTLTNVNQTYHTFSVGEQVILVQMQDDVIGANTTNVSTFGTISSIANAGVYEVATISAV